MPKTVDLDNLVSAAKEIRLGQVVGLRSRLAAFPARNEEVESTPVRIAVLDR